MAPSSANSLPLSVSTAPKARLAPSSPRTPRREEGTARTEAHAPSDSGSANWNRLGRCRSVRSLAESFLVPSTVSISHAAAQACSRSRGSARIRCSSAATRQARAGRRQVGRGVHALAAPLPRRRNEPVRRHLGAHRRGRPAQLPRDLPARGPALQHPLDRVPLVPGEPPVRPSGRLRSGHADRGPGDFGPSGGAYTDLRLRTQRNALR